MEYETDFHSDYIDWVQSRLTALGIKFDANADRLTIETTYWTTSRRSVAAVPRKVIRAKEFQVPAHLQADLAVLEGKFIKGDDVNEHLSKTRLKARSKHFNDGLFNDWNIQHFHFDPANRRDECLFAVVRDETVYFLDILPHEHYGEISLRERMKSNGWEHLLGHKMTIAGGDQLSNQEIMDARAAGLTPISPLSDGSIYYGGGGISTAGVGTASVDRAARARDKLRAWQEFFDTEGIARIQARGVTFNGKPTFKLVGDPDGNFDVVDSAGTIRMPMGSIHPVRAASPAASMQPASAAPAPAPAPAVRAPLS